VALYNQPGRTTQQARVTRRTLLGGTLIAMLLLTGGWVASAAFTVTQGTTETGGGSYHSTSAIAFWTETSVGVTTVPGVAPAVLSTAVTPPTTLAGTATTYAINTPTGGDLAHYWKFTESAGAAVNTEVELAFTVSTGAGITAVTSYVETQATAPGAAIVFSLLYDLGSPSGGTITLNSVTEVSQQCSAVGTCP